MASVPQWISSVRSDRRRKQWSGWYQKPWTVKLGRLQAPLFKWKLWKHGKLSPHFSRAEAKSSGGVDVPRSLRRRAQLHAFSLERVRHDAGDKPIAPLSWYRDPATNDRVGGVSNSRHLKADATDWERQREAVDKALRRHFTGIGLQDGVWVRHADNGPRRSWTY